ncbi:choline dehydrogenase-like flavoprotein [Hydrogenophaga laconesensis]|uniref:Choline dehydrogenase-like flavoprotein n=2 Tax=Hydrogenophaga laconesensis TaxID=1805971 RepID=A0ABU1VJ34_9BURK|nr:choline dehydrogenase-like flavoprotein [Hydrogenophaga laconesensis]
MVSGIGPGQHLAERSVQILLDRQGVGQNLQDHPLLSISSYLSREARADGASRRNFAYLRYSSGMAEGWDSDMIMMAICRSSWHAVGRRIGTLSANLAYAFSRGAVRISSTGIDTGPEVAFNWLADKRDRDRMVDAFHRMARIYGTGDVSRFASFPFMSSYSARVRVLQQNTFRNTFLTNMGAALMESSKTVRRLMIENYIQDTPPLKTLLSDRDLLEAYICRNVGSTFHPVGTCRLGAEDDPLAVTAPDSRVIGTQNIFVADASLMPEITRTNTNIPAIMIGEKVADLIKETT